MLFRSCTTSGSYDVTNSTDCDDADADTFPGAASSDSSTACMNDDDGDNYGDTTAPSGGTAGTDCDDTLSAVKPGATETCSTAYDDDCDGSANDTGATGCTTYYYDGDNDGYGLSSSSQCTCSASGSYDVTTSTDCDDAAATTYPTAADTFATNDGVDNDCDGYIDETGVAYGDLVITEFFGGNATATYDWVEFYNNSGDTISLANWTLTFCQDDSTTESAPYTGACASEVVVTFPSSATLADNAYYVVCGSTSASVWTTPADCDLLITSYDSPSYTTSTDIENAVGGFTLDIDGTTIDEVFYWQDSGQDDWPAYSPVATSYSSVQLDLDTINATSPDPADTNDDYSTSTTAPFSQDIWCLSDDAGVTTDWAASFSMYGTPGAINVVCP